MRRWASLACLSLLAAGPGFTGPSATAAGADRAAPAKQVATQFALKGRGFGTMADGGGVPADSGTTAFQRIGCTNKAGQTRKISEATVDIPGLGVASGVATTIRTTRHKGVVSSTSTQRIASVVIDESPLGSLSLEAVRSEARAFHDGTRFRALATSDVGRLVLTPAGGEPEVLPIPSAGHPVTVPGIAIIRVGTRATNVKATGATAKAIGLNIRVLPSNTKATIGSANARISSGVQGLLFRGSSSALQASGLEGAVTKGRTPLTLMPCQGTRGELLSKAIAGFDLTGAIAVGALSSSQRTKQNGRDAVGFERGTIASLNLGNGALVVRGVAGQANVKRVNGQTSFNTLGTTLGQIIADGEPQTMPDTGVLEIPGVARLVARIVERTESAISVVGLRIILLDGSGAVIDLGTAKIGAKRSGR